MYFVVEMPLNAEGNGPEMDPEKMVETIYCILDMDFLPVAKYKTEAEAEYHCDKLIREWMGIV